MVVERVVTCDGCLNPLDEYGAHWALDIFVDPTDEDEDDSDPESDGEYMHLYCGPRCFVTWLERCFADELEEMLRDG